MPAGRLPPPPRSTFRTRRKTRTTRCLAASISGPRRPIAARSRSASRGADGSPVSGRLVARASGLDAGRTGVVPGDFVELVLGRPEGSVEITLEVPWAPKLRIWVASESRRFAFARDGGRVACELVEEARVLPPGKYRAEVFRQSDSGSVEWGQTSFEVSAASPRRIRIDPVFVPARKVTGRARPGARVAWVAQSAEGPPIVRESVVADGDGRFELFALPPTECLLSCGSILLPVPPGCEPSLDVGELQSG